MANPENKQLPYESTQKDIRDGIDGASAKLTTTELTPRNLADVLAEEIKALTTVVGGLNFINCEVVAQLPTTGISTTTIYLVPKSPAQQDNVYDEYINLDGTVNGWEKIGDTEIDLSNYYTKTETDTLLSGKVDTVAGMGLSHNDFTDTEKTKLSGIESGAEVNVQSDWSQADSSADDYIKNKPSNLVQDASYVHTDNNFTTSEKTKLSGIESGAEVNVQSDWSQSDNTKDDYIKNKPSLAAVATSGSYNDLTDKPTIPDELADLAADSTHRVVTDSQISTWNGKQDDVNLSVVDGKVCITYTV